MSLVKFNHIRAGVILAFVTFSSFSQSTIKGKVTDEMTGKPVPFANVYFASTSIGGATSEDGLFEIKKIPNGKYDLIVSVLGYSKFKLTKEFHSDTYTIDIKLKPDPISLEEITVVADQADRKYFPLFRQYFLGETGNAKRCAILNPNDLNFFYDAEKNTLYVHATKPIIILNRALGYKVYYSLDFFEYHFNNSTKVYQGLARFEEVKNKSHRDSLRYDLRRRIAYHGSVNHFMRSVYRDSVEEEGFYISIADSTAMNWGMRVRTLLDVTQYLSGNTEKKFAFKGNLRLEYGRESEELDYRLNRRFVPQVSNLVFKDPSITIFENGYFIRQLSIQIYGYYSWSEVIGDIIPSNYKPRKR